MSLQGLQQPKGLLVAVPLHLRRVPPGQYYHDDDDDDDDDDYDAFRILRFGNTMNYGV